MVNLLLLVSCLRNRWQKIAWLGGTLDYNTLAWGKPALGFGLTLVTARALDARTTGRLVGARALSDSRIALSQVLNDVRGESTFALAGQGAVVACGCHALVDTGQRAAVAGGCHALVLVGEVKFVTCVRFAFSQGAGSQTS
jgi:hypothetical protein